MTWLTRTLRCQPNRTPSDSWSDVEKQWGTWDDTPNAVHGCVHELFKFKEQNRQLKLLLSIGGWTYSNDERQFNHVADEAGRQKFAQSAVQLVTDWGFDGIDIDWEYPQDAAEARNYVLLLKACREALDAYAAQHAKGYHFLLTVAAPAGPTRYRVMDLEGMDPYVDQWNLMAYDYAGGWDMTTGHGSALFVDPNNMEATKFSTEKAVDDYIARGVDPSKIVMGMPLYGRAFENADGLGKAYSGVPNGEGTYEGTYLYKDLPRPNAHVQIDDVAMGAYSYDPATKELITYDTVETARAKTQWMMNKGLGGMMFWEAAGDKTGDDSLIRTTARTMRGLDVTPNCLSYPNSKYANIASGSLS